MNRHSFSIRHVEGSNETWCTMLFDDNESYEEVHEMVNDNGIGHICNPEVLTINVNYEQLIKHLLTQTITTTTSTPNTKGVPGDINTNTKINTTTTNKHRTEFTIVKGRVEGYRAKRYMRKNDSGKVTYHNVKEITKSLPTKYGSYGTVKQKAVSTVFYNVGREVEIEVIEDYSFKIDNRSVGIGYKF